MNKDSARKIRLAEAKAGVPAGTVIFYAPRGNGCGTVYFGWGIPHTGGTQWVVADHTLVQWTVAEVARAIVRSAERAGVEAIRLTPQVGRVVEFTVSAYWADGHGARVGASCRVEDPAYGTHGRWYAAHLRGMIDGGNEDARTVETMAMEGCLPSLWPAHGGTKSVNWDGLPSLVASTARRQVIRATWDGKRWDYAPVGSPIEVRQSHVD